MPQPMPPQPPQAQPQPLKGSGFQALVMTPHEGLVQLRGALEKVAPEMVGKVDALLSNYEAIVQELAQVASGQPQQPQAPVAAPKQGMVPQNAGPKGVPAL